MDSITFSNIDALYQEGLKAPLLAGQRGRQVIACWDETRGKGEWIKVLRDRWRGLIADAIEQGRDYLFQYTNASGEVDHFPLSAAIRLAAGKTCTAPLIDFLCSPAGISLSAQGEGVNDVQGRRMVRVRVLTVAQSLAWLDGDGRDRVLESIRPCEYDYVVAPLIRQYKIDQCAEDERHLDIPHCFFVVVCGLSGAVPKRIVYADPMADRRNGVDEAFAKISDPDHPDHHLGINEIRATVVKSMKALFPSRITDLTIDDFPRVFLPIDGYREEGMGVALSTAIAKIVQRPLATLGGPVRDRGMFSPMHPTMHALYSPRSNGSSLGQAMLVAFQRVIKASQGMLDEVHRHSMHGFGMPTVTELFMLARLRPKGLMSFWLEFLEYEKTGQHKALYYMLYRETLD